MTARIGWLVVVLTATLLSTDAVAQGRGRGGHDGGPRHGSDGNGRSPSFCRSGEGHPVFGWEWCERRGWGRDRVPQDRQRPRVAARRYAEAAFGNGYADGYERGLEDGRHRRAFDPVRHRWYRDANRGYDSRYGSRAQYQNVYRDGFRSGFEAGYRDGERPDRSGGFRFPWPF